MRKSLKFWLLALTFLVGINGMSYTQSAENMLAHMQISGANNRSTVHSVKEMLKKIQHHYRINLLYEDKLVKGLETTTDLESNQSLSAEALLKKILDPLDLKLLKIQESTYSIAVKDKDKPQLIFHNDTNNSYLSAYANSAPAKRMNALTDLRPVYTVRLVKPDRLVKGIVLDANSKNPLVGASVFVKGNTNIGTITNQAGEFTISVPDKTQSLMIQFVGYKSYELKLGNEDSYTIELETFAGKMEDVIITGIVTRNKESFTGATASFSGDQLKGIGNQNIIQSLKALDPSFILVENNLAGGNPNSLPEIELRGKTSAPQQALKDQFGTDPNQPLFILDGFETSLRTIIDLDMNRVASVTILKDAASTAIYGAKAANGVVVIETIKPKAGKMRLSYAGDFRLEMPDLSGYNLMNAEEKLEFERLSGMYNYQNPGLSAYTQMVLDSLYSQRLAEVRRGVNTYWLNEPVQLGFTNGHTLRAEGGDEQMRYMLGLNYRKIAGAMKGSVRDTWGGNVDLIYRKGKINISNKLYLSGYDSDESPYGSFSVFAKANPYYKKYNEEGIVEKYLDRSMSNSGVSNYYKIFNPLYNVSLTNINNSMNLALQNSLQMIWTLQPYMQLQGAFQISKGSTNTTQFYPSEHTRFDNTNMFEKGEYTNSRVDNFAYQGNIMLTYARVLNKHSITGNARAEIQESNNKRIQISAVGFPAGSNGNPAFSYGYKPETRPFTAESVFRRNNILGSVNYMFDNRFLLDASYRLDGSTAFGSNKKYSPFWSAGIGWNLHREAFLAGMSAINILRIRGNTGYTGNQNFGSISSVSTYGFDSYINQFGQGVGLNTLGNPDLQWQRTKSSNIGADLALLGNRLTATLNVFEKITNPLVVIVDLPSSTGIFGFPMNLGRLQTKGAEAIIGFSPIYNLREGKIWTLRLTGSAIKGTYHGLGNQLESLNKHQQKSLSLIRYKDGYSPDDLWAVHSFGIDPATGKEIFLKKNGQYTFEYDPADIVVAGNSRPDLEGVFSSHLTLKGFTFGLSIRYQYGAHLFNSALFNKVENISLSGVADNQDKRALYDRWINPGDLSKFKGITINQSTPMSSRFIQENNILTGESINMGYDFREASWLNKIRLSGLRVNAYMNDIFRVSSVKTERGIDYPFTKSIALSINATF